MLVMASIIEASLIGGLGLRELEGARSPRFMSTLHKAFLAARASLLYAKNEFRKVKPRI